MVRKIRRKNARTLNAGAAWDVIVVHRPRRAVLADLLEVFDQVLLASGLEEQVREAEAGVDADFLAVLRQFADLGDAAAADLHHAHNAVLAAALQPLLGEALAFVHLQASALARRAVDQDALHALRLQVLAVFVNVVADNLPPAKINRKSSVSRSLPDRNRRG